MRCPFCSQIEDKVVDTRPSDNENVIRRRRECAGCGGGFTTVRAHRRGAAAGRQEGRAARAVRPREDPGRPAQGVHRSGPVPVEELERWSTASSASWRRRARRRSRRPRVGDAVMAELRDIDDVAYVRFASVYWPFRDLGELQAELKNLVERRGKR
jgi:transcriptional repressor NrdR